VCFAGGTFGVGEKVEEKGRWRKRGGKRGSNFFVSNIGKALLDTFKCDGDSTIRSRRNKRFPTEIIAVSDTTSSDLNYEADTIDIYIEDAYPGIASVLLYFASTHSSQKKI
jgi:hypothetical protein